uniref:hypothetical protein n=1 Tax=Mycobacterium sp. TaxID=1785 RepID=UPI003F95999F
DIAALVEGMSIGAAYGSLASGADIMFAEALLGQGVAVNVVLPFAAGDFIEQLVRPAGEAWVTRFEYCLAEARTVRFATEDAYLGDDQLFTYSSSLAMGLASLCARHLHAPLMQLAVWDGVVNDGAAGTAAGTAADMSAWREAGYPVTIVPVGPDADVETSRVQLAQRWCPRRTVRIQCDENVNPQVCDHDNEHGDQGRYSCGSCRSFRCVMASLAPRDRGRRPSPEAHDWVGHPVWNAAGPVRILFFPRLPPRKPRTPGWYPYWYPNNYRHRYWDGQGWTDDYVSSWRRLPSGPPSRPGAPPGWYPNPDGADFLDSSSVEQASNADRRT